MFVAEATTDAYNESEQVVGLLTLSEDNLPMPFETELLEVNVTVERVDLTEGNEIVAICRRGSRKLKVPVLDLPLPFGPRRWPPSPDRRSRASRRAAVALSDAQVAVWRHSSLKVVLRSMAVSTQGDEVFCRVVSQPAAEFPVVDLQVSERPAPLTTPAVSRQNLFAESSVVVEVEPPARLPLAQHAHSGSSGFPIA